MGDVGLLLSPTLKLKKKVKGNPIENVSLSDPFLTNVLIISGDLNGPNGKYENKNSVNTILPTEM